jgi:hypothetical protein
VATEPSSPQLRWPRLLSVGVLALLVFELAAQIFIYTWSGESFRSLSKYSWSAYGLVRNNPELNSPGFKINRNGFRDLRDYQKRKPDNTLRVMLFGGSVLYSGLGGPRVLPEEGRVSSAHTISQYLAAKMEEDPRLGGVNIEVLNAAVNFNRIVEISSSYLAEYVFWDPDVVVFLGSANNVGRTAPPRAEILARSHGIQSPHPWKQDFDRLVVEKSLRSFAENSLRVAEDFLASVAISRLVVTKLVDLLWSSVEARRLSSRESTSTNEGVWLAEREEFDLYFRDYAGYVEAIVATARHHGQDIAFFWEYYLGHMEGIKPLSDREQWLYTAVQQPISGSDYNIYMRDRLHELLASRKVPLIDPFPELRESDETIFIDYLHYTKRGNELMAGVIYDRLKDKFHAQAERLRSESVR